MNKRDLYYWLILLLFLFFASTGCAKTNITLPEKHPSNSIAIVEEPHLNLLSDEDRAIYLKDDSHEEQDIYACKMHPQIISKKPGVCPLCGMKLILKSGK